MKVGFTGTQENLTDDQIFELGELLIKLGAEDKIQEGHHGDCIGADAHFDRMCRVLMIQRVIWPPTNSSKRAFCDDGANTMSRAVIKAEGDYLVRNKKIVDSTDILIACPKGKEQQRSGTWSTVRYARKNLIPIYIIMPDGKIRKE